MVTRVFAYYDIKYKFWLHFFTFIVTADSFNIFHIAFYVSE